MAAETVVPTVDHATALPAPRSAVVASADHAVAAKVRVAAEQMRWRVREASGAAEAIIEIERELPEALILDAWLPDLEVGEFAALLQQLHPSLEILRMDGVVLNKAARSTRRHELLTALREVQATAPRAAGGGAAGRAAPGRTESRDPRGGRPAAAVTGSAAMRDMAAFQIPGLIGASAAMQVLVEMIRLVAPCDTTVLIEGETGTGKELVAHALHRQSSRADQPLVILNCAAIPEALLEAELFGHARGAFTGAVQARTGRIEAADGGTLFLDEIGEMPLALQAKMLRFLECGELQRVGDNVVSRVDARVIAATHQPLEQRAEEGAFRLDLYHRLAVFPIDVPPLRERMEDVPALLEYLLDRLADRVGERQMGVPVRKHLSPEALGELLGHHWPGNVRELKHVLERAVILSESAPVIAGAHIRIRRRPRG